jgi:hypothetical protein
VAARRAASPHRARQLVNPLLVAQTDRCAGRGFTRGRLAPPCHFFARSNNGTGDHTNQKRSGGSWRSHAHAIVRRARAALRASPAAGPAARRRPTGQTARQRSQRQMQSVWPCRGAQSVGDSVHWTCTNSAFCSLGSCDNLTLLLLLLRQLSPEDSKRNNRFENGAAHRA